MPRLSGTQDQARQQLLQLAQRELLPEPLGERLLVVLQLAIPSDIQALFAVDSSSLLFTRLLATNAGGMLEQRAWLEHTYLVHEPGAALTFPGLMRAQLVAVALHDRPETSWGVPASHFVPCAGSDYYHTYHEIGTPQGGVLRGCFAVEGQWIAAVQLLRLDPRHPFRRSDVSFLRLMAPLIARTLRSAFERERACARADSIGMDAAGVLVLAPNRQVVFSNAAAEAWCDLLQSAEMSRGELPTAILSALASLCNDTEIHAQRTLRIATPKGSVRIEASFGSAEGSVAIILAPDQPSAQRDLPTDWPLTRQERQVLTLLARGMSNRQIAERLVISENTVASHLAHAYEKLGIHSRSELLACLFHEAYWPALRYPGSASDPD